MHMTEKFSSKGAKKGDFSKEMELCKMSIADRSTVIAFAAVQMVQVFMQRSLVILLREIKKIQRHQFVE